MIKLITFATLLFLTLNSPKPARRNHATLLTDRVVVQDTTKIDYWKQRAKLAEKDAKEQTQLAEKNAVEARQQKMIAEKNAMDAAMQAKRCQENTKTVAELTKQLQDCKKK
jgi:hypothetical protein